MIDYKNRFAVDVKFKLKLQSIKFVLANDHSKVIVEFKDIGYS